MRILIPLLLLGLQAQAKVCDSNEIINRTCDFFERNKSNEYIVLPDGTRYANPKYKAPETPAQQQDILSGADNRLETEMAVRDLIKRSSLQTLPEKTKLAIGDPEFAMTLAKQIFGKDELGSGAMTIAPFVPWPLTDPKAKAKQLNEQELKEVGNYLNPDQKNELKEIVKTYIKGTQPTVKLGQSSALGDAMTPERKKHVENLYKQTKADFIEVIQKGRPFGSLTVEEQNLIKKIENIQFLHGDSELASQNADCNTNLPNAAYIEKFNVFYLCKNIYQTTDAEIVRTIGHEIGHAIDPCRTKYPLRKFSVEQANYLLSHPDIDKKTKDVVTDLFNQFKDKPFFNSDFVSFFNEDAIKVINENNLFLKVADGVPEQAHPMFKVRQCYVSAKIFQEVDKEDEDRDIKIMQKTDERIGISFDEKSLKRLTDAFQKTRTCMGTINVAPETNEAMSDVYGSAVLAKYLQRHPPTNEAEQFGIIGDSFSRGICPAPEKKMTDAEFVVAMRDRQKMLLRPHPVDKKRISEVILKTPGVAEQFGCEVDRNACISKNASGAAAATSSVSSQPKGGQK